MKNKKGFTLIELLAVIVILVIISLITVPMILGVVEKSRKKAAILSTYGYIDAIEKYSILHDLDAINYPYDLKGQTLNVETSNASIDNKKLNEVIKPKGALPDSGTVTIDSKGKVSKATLIVGKYEVSCSNEICNVTGSSNNKIDDTTISTIADPVSFATDSWEVIINAVKNNNISAYSVGDEKTIDMGKFGTQTVRIANTSIPAECSTPGFSQTACGFVIEFKTVITDNKMNSTLTSEEGWTFSTNAGGWPASELYTYVSNDIYNALPSDLKAGIIDTKVVSSYSHTNGEENFTSTDKLYLLNAKEVLGDKSFYNTAASSTRQMDYYVGKEATNRIKYLNDGSTAKSWWLRTAHPSASNNFNIIDTDGYCSSAIADSDSGVSPAFRIG
jgi:prepilin-type N-terminal cleavage/methylation domain-containing protein